MLVRFLNSDQLIVHVFGRRMKNDALRLDENVALNGSAKQ